MYKLYLLFIISFCFIDTLFSQVSYYSETSKNIDRTCSLYKIQHNANNFSFSYDSLIWANDIAKYQNFKDSIKQIKNINFCISIWDKEYRAFIEQECENNNLPKELSCLPILLSGLNNNCNIYSNKSGIWQLDYFYSIKKGVNILSFYDERNDAILSSMIAIKRIKKLYKIYNNWEDVFQIYTCGIAYTKNNKEYSECEYIYPSFIALIQYLDQLKKINQIKYDMNISLIYLDKNLNLKSICKEVNLDYNLVKQINPLLTSEYIQAKHNQIILSVPKDFSVKVKEEINKISKTY